MRRAFVLLLVAAAVAQVASAAARGPKLHKVPAHFVYLFDNSNGCTWSIGIDFPKVAGAKAYLIKYWDGYYKQVITGTLTLAQLGKDPDAGSGTLYTGVTGGGYSPPCQGAGDPTEGGRFDRGATVYAMLPAGTKLISGTVTKQCPDRCSAADNHGLKGVSVVANGRARRKAVTGPDGTYEIAVPKGKYTVSPSLTGFSFDPDKRKVNAHQDVRSADFRGCDGSATTRAGPVPNFCLGKIAGDLLNRAGGGIEEFPVAIDGRTKSGKSVSDTAVTDHKGHFEVREPDGRYTIDLSDSAESNLWRPSDKRTVTLSGSEAGGTFVTSARCSGGSGAANTDVTRLGTEKRDVISIGLLEAAPTVVALLGDGNDVFRDLRTPALVCTGAGNDEVTLGASDDAVDNSGGADDIVLGGGNDLFRGSEDGETVDGGPGNDDINVFGGNDKVLGGDGDDSILAGAGNDVVDAGPGRDTVDGYTGNDQLMLGPGPNAAVDGGPGHDVCSIAGVDPRSIARDCETVHADQR